MQLTASPPLCDKRGAALLSAGSLRHLPRLGWILPSPMEEGLWSSPVLPLTSTYTVASHPFCLGI